MAPLWLIPAILSIAASASSKDEQVIGNHGGVSCGAPPVRQVVCYWEDVAPLTSLDACMCSQVIFTRGSEYAPDNTTLQLLPEVRPATEILRRRNPDLRTLVRVPVSSSDAKSPIRRQRLAYNIQSMVRKGALNGVELVLEEQREETKVIVPRAALTATLQVIRVQIDSLASSVSTSKAQNSQPKSRRRRSYDVTERQVEDEPPATWRPLLRRNRPLTSPSDAVNVATSTAATSVTDSRGKTTASLTTDAETTEPTVQDDMATESTESLASYSVSKTISSSTVSVSVGTPTSTTAGTSSTTGSSITPDGPTTSGTASTAGTATSPEVSSTSGTSTTAGTPTTSSSSTTTGKENNDGTTIDFDDDVTVSSDDTEETYPETEGNAATAPMSVASTTTKPILSTSTPPTPSPSSSETQPSRRTTRAFADDYIDDYSEDDQYWDSEDDESDEEQPAAYDDDEIITPSVMPSVLLLLRLPVKPDKIAKHYDLKSLSKIVDWYTLPTHNLTDASEAGQAFHPSRLMGLSDTLNTDALVDLVTSMGAPPEKVIVSVPSFALKFTLADASENTPRSAVIAPPAKLDRDELCSMLAIGNWTLERDEDLTAPYAFRQDSWISFEDETSLGIKAKYIVLRSLGGVALDTADGDAWRGGANKETSLDTCSNNGGRLLPALYQGLSEVSRRRRGAVFADLQNDILHSTSTSIYADGVHSSPYRIVRLVDRQGDVHAVRENTQVEFTCSRQGYFSHPLGCNRFYRCVKFDQLVDDYTVFEFDCPPGLAFDEKVEVCVWPGSLSDGRACAGSSEIAPVPRSRFVCPSVEGFYADPENCRWFFACMDHARDGLTPLTAYEFRCPFGLVFDAETLLCDWPWRVVSCGGGRAGLITFNSAGISVYNGASSADSAAFLRSAGGAYANDVGGFGHRLNGDSNAFAVNSVNSGLQRKVTLQSLGLTAPGVASYSIGRDSSGSNAYSVGANGPFSGSIHGSTSDIGTISGLSLLSPDDDDSGASRVSGYAQSAGASSGGFSYSTVVKGNDAFSARGNLGGANTYASKINSGFASAGGLSGQTAYASGGFQPAGLSEGRSNAFSIDAASDIDGSYLQSVTPLPAPGGSVGHGVGTGISYEVNTGLSGEARFATGGAAVAIQSTPANEYLPSSATGTYTGGVKYATSTPASVQTVNRGPAAELEHSSLNGYYSKARDFQPVLGIYKSPISTYSAISSTASPVTGTAYSYSSTPASGAYSSTPASVVYSSSSVPVTKTEYTISSTPATVAQYSAPEYLPPKVSSDQTVEYRSHISTVQSVLPTVQTHEQVQTVTTRPSVVYQERYQAQPIQPVNYEYSKPVVSTYQQVHSVTSKPEIVHTVSANPAVVYQESYQAQPVQAVNYEYTKPAVSTYQHFQTVTSKPEITQQVQHVSTVQPALPTVQTYDQEQTVTVKPAVTYQERYQAQPIQPINYEYSKPAVSTYQQVQSVTSKPEIVQHVSTIQPAVPTIQTFQQVHTVSASPAVVYQESYQAQPVQAVNYEYTKPAVSTYQHFQTVTSKPEITQQVQHVSTVQPALPTVQTYEQVQTVTAKPAVTYQESYQAQPIQSLNYEYTKPEVSTYQQVQIVTSKPEIVQKVSTIQPVAPTVQTFQQVHSVPAKPSVVYQESYQAQPVQAVNYEYTKPAVSTYQHVQAVTSKPEQEFSVPAKPSVVYQESYQAQNLQPIQYEYNRPAVPSYQDVQTVTTKPQIHQQSESVSTVLPTVHTYQQVQPVTVKPSFYQQVFETKSVQPIKYEYTTPAVATFQQVHSVTTRPETFQPAQPISVQYRTPAVSVSEQVQTVTSKPEILQEVRPVQPVTYGLKTSVGSSFQHINLKQVEQFQPIQPAISYEYKSPAVAVQQVQTVATQPQVFQKAEEIQKTYLPASVEYQAPVVQHQTQYIQGGEQYKAALKYQEVKQINNVAQPQPAVYQVNQPEVNIQLANPTPFVHTYHQQKTIAPTIKAQEVVYDYNAPSSIPIRQKETHTVELPNLQYQTYQQLNEVAKVPQAPAVSVKSNLYPFVKTTSQEYVQTVYSTPAPIRYTTADQHYNNVQYSSSGGNVQYASSGANVQYSSAGESQYSGISSTTPISVSKSVATQPAQVSFVSTTPASVEVSNDASFGAYHTATLKECTTCSSSTANLRVSTTPGTVSTTAAPLTSIQFSYQSPGISPGPHFVDVQGYSGQNRTQYGFNGGFVNHVGNNVPDDGSALYFLQPQTFRKSRPDKLDLTYYPAPQSAVSSFDKTTYTVPPAPEKLYVDEPHPEIRYQAEVPRSTLRPIVVAEVTTAQPPIYRESYHTKPSPSVIRTELKQEIPFNQVYLQPDVPQTQITYGIRTKPKVISEFNYVADGVRTVSTSAPVEIENYHSTSGPSIDVYQTAKPAVPVRRLRPTVVPPVEYNQNEYVQNQQQYAANYGSAVSMDEQYLAGLISQGISDGFGTKAGASAGISSTSYVSEGDGQYTAGAEGTYDENGYVQNTLRAKPKEGKKKTKIVIVTRLTDVNPLLVGKLGAQCSCARRRLNLKGRKPGLRKVVRIIRPSTNGNIYSSTTPGYVEVSSSTEKSSEFEEDLALINDAEKEDEFGSKPSSTTPSTLSSSTTLSNRGTYRGRGSYYQAGKAKSTIYVSSTEEPERDDDDYTGDDEELSPVQEDENAIQIPARVSQQSRRGLNLKSDTSSNAVSPSSSQVVDLGSQGTVECMRPGLFRHPQLCNKFYSCNWDSWKKKYVVNIFNCPIHLAYDSSLGACNWPSKGPACVNGKLLV